MTEKMKNGQKKVISGRSKNLWADSTKDENGLTYRERVSAGIKARAAKKREEKKHKDKTVENRVTEIMTTEGTVIKKKDDNSSTEPVSEETSQEKQKIVDEIKTIKPHQGDKPLENFKEEELKRHLDNLKNGKEERTTYNFGCVEVTEDELDG